MGAVSAWRGGPICFSRRGPPKTGCHAKARYHKPYELGHGRYRRGSGGVSHQCLDGIVIVDVEGRATPPKLGMRAEKGRSDSHRREAVRKRCGLEEAHPPLAHSEWAGRCQGLIHSKSAMLTKDRRDDPGGRSGVGVYDKVSYCFSVACEHGRNRPDGRGPTAKRGQFPIGKGRGIEPEFSLRYNLVHMARPARPTTDVWATDSFPIQIPISLWAMAP